MSVTTGACAKWRRKCVHFIINITRTFLNVLSFRKLDENAIEFRAKEALRIRK